MTKTMTVNGVTFEINKCSISRTLSTWDLMDGCEWDSIKSVYNRPSDTKVAIWHDWCRWCNEILDNGGHCSIHISSYTCNFFTISGCVANVDTNYEYLPIMITYAHNRIFI